MRWLGLVTIAVLGVTGAGYFWLQSGLKPRLSEGKVLFEVQKGETPLQISRRLEAVGAVSEGRALYWWGRILGKWSQIRAAEYELTLGASPDAIFQVLSSGVGVLRTVLLREGENIYELAERLSALSFGSQAEILARLRDPQWIHSLGVPSEAESAEGFLFPETYSYTRTTTLESLLRSMIGMHLKIYREEIEPLREQSEVVREFTHYEIVTLASMIEKETGAAFERPLIASVFHNRLKKGMKLQSDPTTIYGIWERYSGNLRRADLLESTPYNTYTVPRLPRGPICAPSREAMIAVLKPEDSANLYFVSRNDGTHVFTKTYEDHLRAVRAFQLDPKAREGKSWRDLKKGAGP